MGELGVAVGGEFLLVPVRVWEGEGADFVEVLDFGGGEAPAGGGEETSGSAVFTGSVAAVMGRGTLTIGDMVATGEYPAVLRLLVELDKQYRAWLEERGVSKPYKA